MSCEALATKAELAALRAELEAKIAIKIDKVERPHIVNEAVEISYSELNPKIEAVKALVVALSAVVYFLKGTVEWLVKQISFILGEIGKALAKALEALAKASEALIEAATARELATDAKYKADSAFETAVSAYYHAKFAEERANQAVSKANEAIKKADDAIIKAELAQFKADEAYYKAQTAISEVETVKKRLLITHGIAVDGRDKAYSALSKITALETEVKQLKSQLSQIRGIALEALALAEKAYKEIEILRGMISSLQGQISSLQARISALEDLIDDLETSISRINGEINRTNQRINQASTNIQGLNQQTGYVTRQYAGVYSNLEQNNQQIGAINRQQEQQQQQNIQYQSATNSNSSVLGRLSSQISALDQRLNNISLSSDPAIQSQIAGLVSAIDAKVNSLSNSFLTIDTKLLGLESQQQLIQPRLEAIVSSTLDANNARVSGLESTVGTLNGTVTANNQRVSGLESTVGTLNGTVTANNQRVSGLEIGLSGVQTTVGTLTDTVTGNDQRIGTIGNSITGLNNRVSGLEGTLNLTGVNISNLSTTVTGVQTQIQGIEMTNTAGLQGINSRLDGIALGMTTVLTNTNPSVVANAAATGVCEQTKSGGCISQALNPIQQGINGISQNLPTTAGLGTLAIGQQAILAQLAGIAATIANIWALLNTVWGFLNTSYDFFKGKFEKLFEHRIFDRFLAVINFALAVHNAAMLSRNLVSTLLETLGNVLTAVGIKDVDGNPVNAGALVGGTIDSWMRGLLGAEVWNGTKQTWTKANRILTAASLLKDSVHAFSQSLAECQETVGGWVAKIGNGLKEEGIIHDDKYPWMDENPQFRSHFSRSSQIIQNLTEAAESVNQWVFGQSGVKCSWSYILPPKDLWTFTSIIYLISLMSPCLVVSNMKDLSFYN